MFSLLPSLAFIYSPSRGESFTTTTKKQRNDERTHDEKCRKRGARNQQPANLCCVMFCHKKSAPRYFRPSYTHVIVRGAKWPLQRSSVRLRTRSRDDMKIKGRKIARARSGGGENICRCSLVLTWQFPTVEYQSGGKGKTRADLRMFLFSAGLAISCA